MSDDTEEEEIVVVEGQTGSDKTIRNENIEKLSSLPRTGIVLTSSQSLKETVNKKTSKTIKSGYNTHSLDEELKKIRSQQSVLTTDMKSVCSTYSGKGIEVKDSKNSKNLISSEHKQNVYSTEGKLLQRQSFIKSDSASLRDSVESDTSSSNSFDKGDKPVKPNPSPLSTCSSLNRSGDSTDLDTNASSYQDETVPIIKQESMESLATGRSKLMIHAKRGYSYQEDHYDHRLHSSKTSALSSTGEENRKQWLTADSASTNTNSRSMESLRQSSLTDMQRRGTPEARSLESLERDMRVMSCRYRRTVSGGESIDENSEIAAAAERKRGLFASASKVPVPSHLSLMPPGSYDRRITILSPHSPMVSQTPGTSHDGFHWQYTTQTIKTRRKKGNIVLPRLVLPGSSEFDPFEG
uniref:Uncharacterized protein n=1 Tax=Cacopsylla melanoneura TaxID=428564 RepID=A0A8D8T7L0_9HEMI